MEYLEPVPDAPPAGSVRIRAEKVPLNPNVVRWRFTIVGAQIWSKSDVKEAVTLSDPYPIEDTTRKGGSNAVVYEYSVQTKEDPKDKTKMTASQEAQLRQAGVRKVTQGGTLTSVSGEEKIGHWNGKQVTIAKMPAEKLIQPLLTGEKTLPIPVDVALLKSGFPDAKGTIQWSAPVHLKIEK